MQPVHFVGSSLTYWLPEDVLVEIDIVPASKIGWVRSGVRNLPFVAGTTWHDTGHPGSTAETERNFLHNGPVTRSTINGKTEIVPLRLGFNFVADGVPRTERGVTYRGKIVQLTPLDEETWAAGTRVGNRISWHVEQCFGGANQWKNALYVAAALHGSLHAAQNWNVRKQLVQHHHWYGKDCPAQIRAKGIWNDVVSMVESAAAASRTAAETSEGRTWPWPKPVLPVFWTELQRRSAFYETSTGTWYRISQQFEVVKETPRLMLPHPSSKQVGPRLVPGQLFWAAAIGSYGGAHYAITPTWSHIQLDHITPVDTRKLASTG